ncbi:MAG: hypothetical protein KF911_00440 [Pseudomonadales bacterium]|nr:hypothetical protein [Pseudomonadales bacterium]
MTERTQGPDSSPSQNSVAGERVVYVMPEHVLAQDDADEIDLAGLFRVLWDAKLTLIAITALCSAIAVAYAMLATPWYRSEVLLAPVEERPGGMLAGQLGGLASLAGVNLGDGGSVAEAVSTLGSRELAAEFIEANGLLTVFFQDDWDPATGSWRMKNPADHPDIRDAIKYFHEDILRVDQNRQTSMVTLSISWTDAEQAARWANELAQRLNQRMRARALREAEANVAFLQAELANTNVVALQQSIGRLLESEMQKLMLARGSEEYAFRVIDSAQPAREPDKPKRLMVVALGTVAGGLLGLLWVLAARALRRPD